MRETIEEQNQHIGRLMEDFVRRAAPQHLSAYILKVEAGTPFGEMGEALQASEEGGADDAG